MGKILFIRISKIGHKTCAMHVLQILRNIVFSPFPRFFSVLPVLTLTFNCKGKSNSLFGGRDAACSYSHNICSARNCLKSFVQNYRSYQCDTEIGMCFYMP